MTWLDKDGLLHLDPQPSDSDNGILFLVEFYILKHLQGKLTLDDQQNFKRAIDKLETFPNTGTYYQRPDSFENVGSHDNATAIASFSYLVGLSDYQRLTITRKLMHPRDVIFYNYLKGSFIAKLLLPITCLFQIITCLRSKEETSGKLLTFVRTRCTMDRSIIMRGCAKICDWILAKKYGSKHWHKIFSIYFKNEDHPNRLWSFFL